MEMTTSVEIASTAAGERKPEARKFLAFLLTGGFAAVCNVASRALLSRMMSYGAAVAIAYVVGMLVAYLLAKIYVFEPAGRSWHIELSRFAVVNGVSFVQVWLVSVGLQKFLLPRMHWTWQPELCAHMVGVASPVVTNYFAHKHFTFGVQEALVKE